jgi:hypothetical protein
VSHKRIAALLAKPDRVPRIGLRWIDPDIPANYDSLPPPPASSPMIELMHTWWRWPNAARDAFVLKLNATFKCKELTTVLGSFGSGKSALLHALVCFLQSVSMLEEIFLLSLVAGGRHGNRQWGSESAPRVEVHRHRHTGQLAGGWYSAREHALCCTAFARMVRFRH